MQNSSSEDKGNGKGKSQKGGGKGKKGAYAVEEEVGEEEVAEENAEEDEEDSDEEEEMVALALVAASTGTGRNGCAPRCLWHWWQRSLALAAGKSG